MTVMFYNPATGDSAYAKANPDGSVQVFSMGEHMSFPSTDEASSWLSGNNFQRV